MLDARSFRGFGERPAMGNRLKKHEITLQIHEPARLQGDRAFSERRESIQGRELLACRRTYLKYYSEAHMPQSGK
jgi:hypothetical protein